MATQSFILYRSDIIYNSTVRGMYVSMKETWIESDELKSSESYIVLWNSTYIPFEKQSVVMRNYLFI